MKPIGVEETGESLVRAPAHRDATAGNRPVASRGGGSLSGAGDLDGARGLPGSGGHILSGARGAGLQGVVGRHPGAAALHGAGGHPDTDTPAARGRGRRRARTTPAGADSSPTPWRQVKRPHLPAPQSSTSTFPSGPGIRPESGVAAGVTKDEAANGDMRWLQQIQARSVSTDSVQSSTAQQPEGPKGQQSDLANMVRHVWSEPEEIKLMEFAEELKELYPDRRNEFCSRLATKMNDHFGGSKGYVLLDWQRVREKIRRIETGCRNQQREVQNGERQHFLPNFFDNYGSFFSAGEGTSSGSVRQKRKRCCPIPLDTMSAIEYLDFYDVDTEELYRYIKALEDMAVLSGFIAIKDHAKRMEYLQKCTDRLIPK